MDYCPSPSVKAPRENEFIVRLRYSRQRCAPVSWLLSDLLLISQTSYKHVSKWLAKSLSNRKKHGQLQSAEKLLHIYAFLLVQIRLSLLLNGISVFVAFFYKFMPFSFQVKDPRGDYWSCADCQGNFIYFLSFFFKLGFKVMHNESRGHFVTSANPRH